MFHACRRRRFRRRLSPQAPDHHLQPPVQWLPSFAVHMLPDRVASPATVSCTPCGLLLYSPGRPRCRDDAVSSPCVCPISRTPQQSNPMLASAQSLLPPLQCQLSIGYARRRHVSSTVTTVSLDRLQAVLILPRSLSDCCPLRISIIPNQILS